jgi:hypothetical protein
MASAEAGRFASLFEEDFEFNLVDQFFKLVRIVVKTCLLLILFLNITIKNFYLCLFNSHIKISNWIFMCKIVILSAFNFI